jgi:hypothetical protein
MYSVKTNIELITVFLQQEIAQPGAKKRQK